MINLLKKNGKRNTKQETSEPGIETEELKTRLELLYDVALKVSSVSEVSELIEQILSIIQGNPLSALSLNLQLLVEDGRGEQTPEAKRRARRLEVVRRETKRLNDILEEFLRFAREHKLELRTADINKVVGRVLDFQSAEALSRGVQIRSSFGEVPRVRLDEDLFRQALLNITINAEQAMPEGGDLMVRTCAVRESVNIDVVDTGIGIPDDVMPRLFDVYFSTKARGTGLGLPTACRIIEEHGGTITVHSRPGEGTCVTISLPGVIEK